MSSQGPNLPPNGQNASWRTTQGFLTNCPICQGPMGRPAPSQGKFSGKIFQKCMVDDLHRVWNSGVELAQIEIFNAEREAGHPIQQPPSNVYPPSQSRHIAPPSSQLPYMPPPPSQQPPMAPPPTQQYQSYEQAPAQPPASQTKRVTTSCTCGGQGNTRCETKSCKSCCRTRAVQNYNGNICSAQDHQRANREAVSQVMRQQTQAPPVLAPRQWGPPQYPPPHAVAPNYSQPSLSSLSQAPQAGPSYNPRPPVAGSSYHPRPLDPTRPHPNDPYVLSADNSPRLRAKFLDPQAQLAKGPATKSRFTRKFTLAFLREGENLVDSLAILENRFNTFRLDEHEHVFRFIEREADLRRWNNTAQRWDVFWIDEEYEIREDEEVILRPASMDLVPELLITSGDLEHT